MHVTWMKQWRACVGCRSHRRVACVCELRVRVAAGHCCRACPPRTIVERHIARGSPRHHGRIVLPARVMDLVTACDRGGEIRGWAWRGRLRRKRGGCVRIPEPPPPPNALQQPGLTEVEHVIGKKRHHLVQHRVDERQRPVAHGRQGRVGTPLAGGGAQVGERAAHGRRVAGRVLRARGWGGRAAVGGRATATQQRRTNSGTTRMPRERAYSTSSATSSNV